LHQLYVAKKPPPEFIYVTKEKKGKGFVNYIKHNCKKGSFTAQKVRIDSM